LLGILLGTEPSECSCDLSLGEMHTCLPSRAGALKEILNDWNNTLCSRGKKPAVSNTELNDAMNGLTMEGPCPSVPNSLIL
jgi:hypothetical protein